MDAAQDSEERNKKKNIFICIDNQIENIVVIQTEVSWAMNEEWTKTESTLTQNVLQRE